MFYDYSVFHIYTRNNLIMSIERSGVSIGRGNEGAAAPHRISGKLKTFYLKSAWILGFVINESNL